MALAFSSGGTITEIPSSPVTITWDGTEKLETFVFEDATGPAYDADTYLHLGQAAYGIFNYDSGAGCNTDEGNQFPAGSKRWTTFTYVPGTPPPSFDRKVSN